MSNYGEYEGATSGTNIPMFKGIQTPAYGATWDDEYVKAWRDWYYRNGSMQNGMFVAPGATAEMYGPNMQFGGYKPEIATKQAQQYLEENPTSPFVPKGPDINAQNAASANARAAMEKAFRDYGISDLSPYTQNIEDRLAKTIAGIPKDATDLDKYFGDQNLGPTLISELEPGYRKNALDAFDKDIQTDYFADTADDPYINSMIQEDRVGADKYIQNMLDRGQIIGSGAEAAMRDLDRQAGLGSTRLNEIGAGLLNTQEGILGTERGKRRSNYSNLKLGQSYDVGADDAALDKMASDFLGTLGTGLRTGLGSTPIFSTSGLGAVAGGAQGGQNTTFAPPKGGVGGASNTGLPSPKEEDTEQDVLF